MSSVCRTCVGSGVWLRLGCASERKVNETMQRHLHKLRCVFVCVSEIYQNYLIT